MENRRWLQCTKRHSQNGSRMMTIAYYYWFFNAHLGSWTTRTPPVMYGRWDWKKQKRGLATFMFFILASTWHHWWFNYVPVAFSFRELYHNKTAVWWSLQSHPSPQIIYFKRSLNVLMPLKKWDAQWRSWSKRQVLLLEYARERERKTAHCSQPNPTVRRKISYRPWIIRRARFWYPWFFFMKDNFVRFQISDGYFLTNAHHATRRNRHQSSDFPNESFHINVFLGTMTSFFVVTFGDSGWHAAIATITCSLNACTPKG